MRLQDKVAIVTGGASGFGAGIVRKFAAEGARVLIADINIEGAEALARELGQKAGHVDVSKDASVNQLVAAALMAFGKAHYARTLSAFGSYIGASEASAFTRTPAISIS